MILDTYSEVYVWVGRGANEVEKKESLRAAVDYIRTDPSKRDLDSTLLLQVTVIHCLPVVSKLSCVHTPSFLTPRWLCHCIVHDIHCTVKDKLLNYHTNTPGEARL